MRRLRSSICPAWGTDSPHPSCELRPRSCPGPGTVRPERVVPPRFAEPRGAVPGPGSDCPPRALTAHPVEVPNAALLRPFSETLILGAAPAAPLGSLGRGESGC